MAMLRKTSWVLVGFVFGGALFGGVLAEALRAFSSDGALRNVFLKGYKIGVDPPFTLDLHLITTTIGFTLEMNLFVVLGMLLGVLIYKQV